MSKLTLVCQNCDQTLDFTNKTASRFCSKSCQYQKVGKIHRERAKARRDSAPLKLCKQCQNPIMSRTAPLFCNRSCSATYHNASRGPMSQEQRIKISNTMREKVIIDITEGFKNVSPKLMKRFIVGPYTPIYRNICKKTGLVFYAPTYKKYHPSVITDRQHYAYLCQFKFSISQFPLWFDGTIIKEHGWYSTPGSRKGLTNTNGVSRDHRLSIQDGWESLILPSVICHPANCLLTLHKNNQRKKCNSSITLDELMVDIKKFEQLYPNWQK